MGERPHIRRLRQDKPIETGVDIVDRMAPCNRKHGSQGGTHVLEQSRYRGLRCAPRRLGFATTELAAA